MDCDGFMQRKFTTQFRRCRWRKPFPMPVIRGFLSVIFWNVENVVICYAESGWTTNPWMVLGIRSRQCLNSFNGYSPAVYFPFFLFTVTVKRNRINFGRRLTHKQMRQQPPLYQLYKSFVFPLNSFVYTGYINRKIARIIIY